MSEAVRENRILLIYRTKHSEKLFILKYQHEEEAPFGARIKKSKLAGLRKLTTLESGLQPLPIRFLFLAAYEC